MCDVFIFLGSKSPESKSKIVAEKLENILKIEGYSVNIYDPIISPIRESDGNRNNFEDMKTLKEEILDCKAIILISPVYMHNVSGTMKIFLDRIALWCHTMQLSGKISCSISISSSSGNIYVNNYLDYILMYLGTFSEPPLSLVSKDFENNTLDNKIGKLSRDLCYHLLEVPKISESQEDIYLMNQKDYLDNDFTLIEKKMWEDKKRIDFHSFQELFNRDWSVLNEKK